MIGFCRINIIPTRRLNADDNITKLRNRKRQCLFVLKIKRIGFWFSPTLNHFILNLLGKPCKEVLVMTQGNRFANDATITRRIGGPFLQMLNQSITIVGKTIQVITTITQGIQHIHRARRSVQPDAIAKPSIAIWVIRKNNRNAFFSSFLLCELHPFLREFGNIFNASLVSLMDNDIGLNRIVERLRILESNRTRKHSPIHFRQRNIHRQIPCR